MERNLSCRDERPLSFSSNAIRSYRFAKVLCGIAKSQRKNKLEGESAANRATFI